MSLKCYVVACEFGDTEEHYTRYFKGFTIKERADELLKTLEDEDIRIRNEYDTLLKEYYRKYGQGLYNYKSINEEFQEKRKAIQINKVDPEWRDDEYYFVVEIEVDTD